MTIRLEDGVIDLPVEEGARIASLALLAACDEAAARLESGDGAEALHDFRVAVRRLRTALRSFRPSLRPSVSRSRENRLRDVARDTNLLRDAEVQLSWILAQRDALSARHRPAVDLLSRRLTAHGERDPGEARRAAAERYRRVAGKLARRLRTYERTIAAPGGHVPFGAALAAAIERELARLRRRLAAIQGPADERNVHRARIAGKRLRYLLEILQGTRHAAAHGVKQLKGLQDILGEIHDSHVVAATIAGALVDAATEQALRIHAAVQGPAPEQLHDQATSSPRAGLLELDRLTRERRDALFVRLEAEWRGGGGEAFAARVQEIVSSLEARAGGRLERERVYVLSASPDVPAGARCVDVAQGWLPGERLVEHVRRDRAPGGERCWRALDVCRAGARLAQREETAREIFEALWPLTEGRRIELRRTTVEEGGAVWIVEEFTDRALLLARTALSPEQLDPELPGWLRPLVRLEVTEDPDFSYEALARTRGVPTRAERAEPPPEVHSG